MKLPLDPLWNPIIATGIFAAILVVVFFLYKGVFRFLLNRISKTESKFDDFILDLFKIPLLWLIYWILLKVFSHIYLQHFSFYPYLLHINSLLIIFSVAWMAIKAIKAVSYYIQNKLDITVADNLNARKTLTQIKVFQRIANTIIIIIAFSIALLTFKQARNIGVSLLTSAGIIGIIVGLAAQKSIGMIFAGIQLAITQPIRLDDVVIVEGEWGRIEEITLTYVVVKIWDERRLILPVTYFLEKPFENWTRTSANIMGSVFLYVGYDFPVDAIRQILPGFLEGNKNWDGRIANVQVTNTNELYQEIRILLSSSDASKNWDLRTEIREKLINFVNKNYPGAFVQYRVKPIKNE